MEELRREVEEMRREIGKLRRSLEADLGKCDKETRGWREKWKRSGRMGWRRS